LPNQIKQHRHFGANATRRSLFGWKTDIDRGSEHDMESPATFTHPAARNTKEPLGDRGELKLSWS